MEEARNQVAFVRGPLVYCAETADLPGIDDITGLYVTRTTAFTPHREQGPLGKVVVLRGQGVHVPTVAGSLYAEVEDAATVARATHLDSLLHRGTIGDQGR